MNIAYCYHNLALMGIDAVRVLREIAEMSGPRFSDLLLGFVRRPPDLKSLEAIRLQVVQTPDGPVADFIP